MINEANYNSETELQDWVFANINVFLPRSTLIPGFQVTTISGKSGVPDAFVFNFEDREWFVVECELLTHGVWPHIAEQITRFVVALQNPEALRKIRDRLFEHLLKQNMSTAVVSALDTQPERLHQQLELFVESVEPHLVIFIDQTNRDLEDMAQALNIPTKVFRVKKFLVDGNPEYYSPDQREPALVSEPTEKGPASEYDIIELLGGGQLRASVRRFKCYRLQDSSVVYVKKSKYYASQDYYWYAITLASLEYIREYSITHVVFVMADFGFAKVPISLVNDFLKHTGTSKNPDGSLRHYHLLISHGPDPKLYWSNEQPKYSLVEYFQAFD